jgi:Xaa-Pro aminopeptidase
MSKVRILFTFFSILFLVQGLHAQKYESDKMMDLLDLIRNEKFDLILPQAMQDNKIDMWIQVMGTKNGEEGNLDPLRLDLGSNTGIFIFTDRGGDRVERAVLGNISDIVQDCGAYDIFGPESDLTKFVSKRDPNRIAVNFSETIAACDGISHTDYLKLVNMLGNTYAERIVSAENLITDFRTRRVMSEIVFYGELCKETLEVMEKAFDTVEPGVTTLKDLGRWLRNQNMARGFDSMIQLAFLPAAFCQDADGHESLTDDHVIQGGDLVHIDFGTVHMNYRTDIKRLAYVLREGETALPPEIQKTLDDGLKAREIFRKNIKVGLTGRETFEILKRKLEEAGFYYLIRGHIPDPEKTGISIGFHPLGNSWPADGVGPSISQRSSKAQLKIPAYHLFVLEYTIHMPMPEWGKGKHIYMALEDDVIVTERGVEFLYPPMKQIRLIH